jgi:hypothetical protein
MLRTLAKHVLPTYNPNTQFAPSSMSHRTVGMPHETALDFTSLSFLDPRHQEGISEMAPALIKFTIGTEQFKYTHKLAEQGGNGTIYCFSSKKSQILVKTTTLRRRIGQDLTNNGTLQRVLAQAPELIVYTYLCHDGTTQIMERGHGDVLTLYNSMVYDMAMPFVQFCIRVGRFFLDHNIACPDYKLENVIYFLQLPHTLTFRLIDLESIIFANNVPPTVVITNIMPLSLHDPDDYNPYPRLYWYGQYRRDCEYMDSIELGNKYELYMLAHTVYSILYSIDSVLSNTWVWSTQYVKHVNAHILHKPTHALNATDKERLCRYSYQLYTQIHTTITGSIPQHTFL